MLRPQGQAILMLRSSAGLIRGPLQLPDAGRIAGPLPAMTNTVDHADGAFPTVSFSRDGGLAEWACR